MQTVYRIKAQEISMAFLKSLKAVFADKEVIITVESVDDKKTSVYSESQKNLLRLVNENRESAPMVSLDLDIRQFIDDSQYPEL